MAGLLVSGLFIKTCTQTPGELMPKQIQKSHATSSPPEVYEDDEIKILFSSGWKVSRTDRPAVLLVKGHPAVVQFPAPGHGLLLTKNGYTLSLNDAAGQTSPIGGGRFFEVFRIPWLVDVSDTWGCGGYFLEKSQQPSQGLLFFNLVFDSGSSEVRKACGIPKDLVIERRWFAGYFTTAKGAWIFDSDGAECAEKAYTLTSDAKTPDQLPFVDDLGLKKIIKEAMDIVSSIHYKRCPPAQGLPSSSRLCLPITQSASRATPAIQNEEIALSHTPRCR